MTVRCPPEHVRSCDTQDVASDRSSAQLKCRHKRKSLSTRVRFAPYVSKSPRRRRGCKNAKVATRSPLDAMREILAVFGVATLPNPEDESSDSTELPLADDTSAVEVRTETTLVFNDNLSNNNSKDAAQVSCSSRLASVKLAAASAQIEANRSNNAELDSRATRMRNSTLLIREAFDQLQVRRRKRIQHVPHDIKAWKGFEPRNPKFRVIHYQSLQHVPEGKEWLKMLERKAKRGSLGEEAEALSILDENLREKVIDELVLAPVAGETAASAERTAEASRTESQEEAVIDLFIREMIQKQALGLSDANVPPSNTSLEVANFVRDVIVREIRLIEAKRPKQVGSSSSSRTQFAEVDRYVKDVTRYVAKSVDRDLNDLSAPTDRELEARGSKIEVFLKQLVSDESQRVDRDVELQEQRRELSKARSNLSRDASSGEIVNYIRQAVHYEMGCMEAEQSDSAVADASARSSSGKASSIEDFVREAIQLEVDKFARKSSHKPPKNKPMSHTVPSDVTTSDPAEDVPTYIPSESKVEEAGEDQAPEQAVEEAPPQEAPVEEPVDETEAPVEEAEAAVETEEESGVRSAAEASQTVSPRNVSSDDINPTAASGNVEVFGDLDEAYNEMDRAYAALSRNGESFDDETRAEFDRTRRELHDARKMFKSRFSEDFDEVEAVTFQRDIANLELSVDQAATRMKKFSESQDAEEADAKAAFSQEGKDGEEMLPESSMAIEFGESSQAGEESSTVVPDSAVSDSSRAAAKSKSKVSAADSIVRGATSAPNTSTSLVLGDEKSAKGSGGRVVAAGGVRDAQQAETEKAFQALAAAGSKSSAKSKKSRSRSKKSIAESASVAPPDPFALGAEQVRAAGSSRMKSVSQKLAVELDVVTQFESQKSASKVRVVSSVGAEASVDRTGSSSGSIKSSPASVGVGEERSASSVKKRKSGSKKFVKRGESSNLVLDDAQQGEAEKALQALAAAGSEKILADVLGAQDAADSEKSSTTPKSKQAKTVFNIDNAASEGFVEQRAAEAAAALRSLPAIPKKSGSGRVVAAGGGGRSLVEANADAEEVSGGVSREKSKSSSVKVVSGDDEAVEKSASRASKKSQSRSQKSMAADEEGSNAEIRSKSRSKKTVRTVADVEGAAAAASEGSVRKTSRKSIADDSASASSKQVQAVDASASDTHSESKRAIIKIPTATSTTYKSASGSRAKADESGSGVSLPKLGSSSRRSTTATDEAGSSASLRSKKSKSRSRKSLPPLDATRAASSAVKVRSDADSSDDATTRAAGSSARNSSKGVVNDYIASLVSHRMTGCLSQTDVSSFREALEAMVRAEMEAMARERRSGGTTKATHFGGFVTRLVKDEVTRHLGATLAASSSSRSQGEAEVEVKREAHTNADASDLGTEAASATGADYAGSSSQEDDGKTSTSSWKVNENNSATGQDLRRSQELLDSERLRRSSTEEAQHSLEQELSAHDWPNLTAPNEDPSPEQLILQASLNQLRTEAVASLTEAVAAASSSGGGSGPTTVESAMKCAIRASLAQHFPSEAEAPQGKSFSIEEFIKRFIQLEMQRLREERHARISSYEKNLDGYLQRVIRRELEAIELRAFEQRKSRFSSVDEFLGKMVRSEAQKQRTKTRAGVAKSGSSGNDTKGRPSSSSGASASSGAKRKSSVEIEEYVKSMVRQELAKMVVDPDTVGTDAEKKPSGEAILIVVPPNNVEEYVLQIVREAVASMREQGAATTTETSGSDSGKSAHSRTIEQFIRNIVAAEVAAADPNNVAPSDAGTTSTMSSELDELITTIVRQEIAASDPTESSGRSGSDEMQSEDTSSAPSSKNIENFVREMVSYEREQTQKRAKPPPLSDAKLDSFIMKVIRQEMAAVGSGGSDSSGKSAVQVDSLPIDRYIDEVIQQQAALLSPFASMVTRPGPQQPVTSPADIDTHLRRIVRSVTEAAQPEDGAGDGAMKGSFFDLVTSPGSPHATFSQKFFRSRDEELMYKFKAYAGLHGPNDVPASVFESFLHGSPSRAMESATLIKLWSRQVNKTDLHFENSWPHELSKKQMVLLYEAFVELDFDQQTQVRAADTFGVLLPLKLFTPPTDLPYVRREITGTDSQLFAFEEFLYVMSLAKQIIRLIENDENRAVTKEYVEEALHDIKHLEQLFDRFQFQRKTKKTTIQQHYRSKVNRFPDKGLKLGSYMQSKLLNEDELADVLHEIWHHFPGIRSPYLAEPYPNIPSWKHYMRRQEELYNILEDEKEKIAALAAAAAEEERQTGKRRVTFTTIEAPKRPSHVPEPSFHDMDIYGQLLDQVKNFRKMSRMIRYRYDSMLPDLIPPESELKKLYAEPEFKTTAFHPPQIPAPSFKVVKRLINQTDKLTRDNDTEMRMKIDKSKKNFYEEIKTHMMNTALKNWKECKVEKIKAKKLRRNFEIAHHQYFPRKRKNMVVQNVMTEHPANTLDMESAYAERLPAHELLSRNPLVEQIQLEDAKQAMTKSHFPDPIMPPTSPAPNEFLR